MNVFTEGLPEVSFSASLDSKGRITVPARIRNKLGMERGDEVSVSIDASRAIVENVESYREALELIQSLDSVKSFSYRDGILEVVAYDR